MDTFQPCCQRLAITVDEDSVPIAFHHEVNEYQITGPGGRKTVMAYCPFCGIKLPESSRPSHEASSSDMEDLLARLGNWKCLDDIEKELGEATITIPHHLASNGKTERIFDNQWQTMILHVYTCDDGQLDFVFEPRSETKETEVEE